MSPWDCLSPTHDQRRREKDRRRLEKTVLAIVKKIRRKAKPIIER